MISVRHQRETILRAKRESHRGHSSGYLSFTRSCGLIGFAARNFACSTVSNTNAVRSSPGNVTKTSTVLLETPHTPWFVLLREELQRIFQSHLRVSVDHGD